MKNKKIITLIVLLILVCIIFCGYNIIKGVNKIKSYDEITYTEYTKLVSSKKSFILYIGSANCSHCQEFKPTIEDFIKDYQLDIKYIDISKLDDKQYSVLKNKTKVSGTPTIVIFKNGIVESGSSNKIQGSVSYQYVEDFFRNKGYID